MIKTEFEFNLTSPVEYHKGGDSIPCHILVLHAPSYKNRKYTTKLKQSFMRAIKDMQKTNEPVAAQEQSNDIDGVGVAGLLLMSDVDLNECYEDFKMILLHGGAFVEPDIPMTDLHFNQLMDDDLELLLGEYIANFLIPSWMTQTMKKSNI
jgi:hypothetical protein